MTNQEAQYIMKGINSSQQLGSLELACQAWISTEFAERLIHELRALGPEYL